MWLPVARTLLARSQTMKSEAGQTSVMVCWDHLQSLWVGGCQTFALDTTVGLRRS